MPAVIAFGGDCAAMLDDDTIATALGAEVVAEEYDVYPPLAQLGALECGWTSERAILSVAAIPLIVVDDDVRSRHGRPTCDDDAFCTGAIEHGDLWFAVELGRATDRSTDAARAAVEAILDALAESRPSSPSARPAEPRPDWWPAVSCDQLDAAVDVADVLGVPAVEPVFPSDIVPHGAVHETLVAAGVDVWCPWSTSDPPEQEAFRAVEVQVWPGSSSATEHLLENEGAQEVAVTGSDQAVLIASSSTDMMSLYAIVGPNALWVYSATVDEPTLALLAEKVIASLST